VILTEPERARLLEATHDAILVRDLDGTIRYWNRGAEEVYGCGDPVADA
jgi:PAS domain S-box-containing protein